MRRRVALLHTITGFQADDFMAAANRLQVDCLLANDHCRRLDDPWGDGALPLRFREAEKAATQLAAWAREKGVDAIIAVGDRPTLVAALASAALGLPCNQPDAVRACRNKLLARQRMQAAGMRVPTFLSLSRHDDPRAVLDDVDFPCVIKPLALTASRGVMRADDADGFIAAFERLANLLSRSEIQVERTPWHDSILVERFVPGPEVALEGVVTGGRLFDLALFDKPDPLDGPTFAETIYVTPSRHSDADQRAVFEACQEAVSALGLAHGPIHAEVRLSSDGPVVLELAARSIGGLCSRTLRFGAGVSLEELIIRHALGEDVSRHCRERTASAVMMIPVPKAGTYRSARGIGTARQLDGVVDVVITAKPGQRLEPLPEGGSYLGFIFARSETPAEADIAVRMARDALSFDITAGLRSLAPDGVA